MTLILAVIPVLLLIILMAFFKMSGDKSSIISLIVTMLIALFGFAFSVDNLFYSFLYGALKAVSPILIIILMAIFSYNVLLKTEKMEIIKQQFASISTDKSTDEKQYSGMGQPGNSIINGGRIDRKADSRNPVIL